MARHKSLRDLLWGIPVEQEVDEEIAAHLEMQTRRYIAAGMEPAPELGHGFTAEDGKEGSEKVVLLSHALWTRRFGADRRILGRAINIGGRPRTVIGVMPEGVRFPDAPVEFLRERADLWLPYGWEQARDEDRGDQYLGVLARLRPGNGMEQARGDLDAIAARFRTQFPDRALDRSAGPGPLPRPLEAHPLLQPGQRRPAPV